VVPDGL